jgi:8-oxo-dGTP pyrophosphatase MutT (NUDIX family)
MLGNVIAGLITAAILAVGGLLWSHRHRLGLLRLTTRRGGRLRVSVAVLLRVRDDDGYVLIHHPYRPNAYGPPGGVVKYEDQARRVLDDLGFVAHRSAGRASEMSHDLRGFVPARRGLAFLRWYDKVADRETPEQCLLRELREELAEAGHPELIPLVAGLRFDRVRAVEDGPRPTPGKDYPTLRSFEVYDIVTNTPQAVEFVTRLLALGRDPAETEIIVASAADLENGRSGPYLITPQSAFLIGSRRIHEDVPALQ